MDAEQSAGGRALTVCGRGAKFRLRKTGNRFDRRARPAAHTITFDEVRKK